MDESADLRPLWLVLGREAVVDWSPAEGLYVARARESGIEARGASRAEAIRALATALGAPPLSRRPVRG